MEFEFKVNNCNFDKLNKDNFSVDYEFLLGDIKIVDDLEFININFNIPLLDFAKGMSIIMNELTIKEEGILEFDFTEGEGILIFTKKRNQLSIFLDFDETSLNVEFDDFCKATVELNRKIKNLVIKNVEIIKFPLIMDTFNLIDNIIKE